MSDVLANGVVYALPLLVDFKSFLATLNLSLVDITKHSKTLSKFLDRLL